MNIASPKKSKTDKNSNIGPPPFCIVEADIIQVPGKTKLSHQEMKLLIALRMAAGDDDGEKNVVLRSKARLMTESGIKTLKTLDKALARLQNWPSRRQSSIKKIKNGRIYMNDVLERKGQGRGVKFIKVYRNFWYSELPESLKSLVLFARTRFEGKDENGKELFSLPIRGRKQPSVMKCCYMAGTHFDQRLKTAHEMVELGIQNGLLEVVEWSSRQKAMVVRLNDSTRTRTVSKTYAQFSGNTNKVLREHEKQSEGTQKVFSGNDSSEPFLRVLSQSPSPNAGEGSSIEQGVRSFLNDEDKSLIEEVESFLKVEWEETKANPERIAKTLSEFLTPFKELIKEIPDEFKPSLAQVIEQAIHSDGFRGFRVLSWGLLFTGDRPGRLDTAIRSALSVALEGFYLFEEQKEKAKAAIAEAVDSTDAAVRYSAFSKVIDLDRRVAASILAREQDTATALRMGHELAMGVVRCEGCRSKFVTDALAHAVILPGAKKAEEWWNFEYAVQAYSKLHKQNTKPEGSNAQA